MINLYGLIGKTLKHSFSQKYFRSKFEKEGIVDSDYLLFELADIEAFPTLIKETEGLKGLNVTIPYKQSVMPFLDQLHPVAKAIGAVNAIKIERGSYTIGYNTDYLGFKNSLEQWLKPPFDQHKALVLGTGGASKAIKAALEALDIAYYSVSRTATEKGLTYEQLQENTDLLVSHKLVINTTPLGTSPNVNEAPDLDYDAIGEGHYLYDLVYNPAETLFLKKGKTRGAETKNGLEMLEIQAEEAWKIWNG